MSVLKFFIPQVENKALFETSLEPTASELNKLALDVGEGEIGAARGKKTKVAVGEPYYENLISRLKEKNEDASHEINHLAKKHDFHFASLSCSFLPDTDCKLVWARFGVELSARSESGEPLDEKPIAFDISPSEILSQTTYKRETNFSLGLPFNFGLVKVDPTVNQINRREYIFYEPEISAFGIMRSNIAWDFKSTEQRGIWGNKKDLLLIIRAPKNSKIKGRFKLGADVEFKIGRWRRILRFARRKREDKIVDIEYPLSE